MLDDWKVLQGIVRDSLFDLVTCDTDLLRFAANERAVTHKLGEYIRDHVEMNLGQARRQAPRIAVDCEYNRMGMDGNPKKLPWYREEEFGEAGPHYTPSPDIVVHHRGDHDSNRLVIEAKTYFNTGEAVDLLDRMKLVGYLGNPTFYAFGLFLIIGLKDGKIHLDQARLLDKKCMEALDSNEQEAVWNRCTALLVEVTGGSASLKRPNAEINAEANKLIGPLETAFGFRDCLNELK